LVGSIDNAEGGLGVCSFDRALDFVDANLSQCKCNGIDLHPYRVSVAAVGNNLAYALDP
jgi:hypothetical protein